MMELYSNSGSEKTPSDFKYYNDKMVQDDLGGWIKCGRKIAGDWLEGQQYHEWPKG